MKKKCKKRQYPKTKHLLKVNGKINVKEISPNNIIDDITEKEKKQGFSIKESEFTFFGKDGQPMALLIYAMANPAKTLANIASITQTQQSYPL